MPSVTSMLTDLELETHTETEMSLFSWNILHWLSGGLLFQQLTVLPTKVEVESWKLCQNDKISVSVHGHHTARFSTYLLDVQSLLHSDGLQWGDLGAISMRGTAMPGVGTPMLEIGRPMAVLSLTWKSPLHLDGVVFVLGRRPGPCVTLCDMSLGRCLGQWQRGFHLRAVLPLGEALGRG